MFVSLNSRLESNKEEEEGLNAKPDTQQQADAAEEDVSPETPIALASPDPNPDPQSMYNPHTT